MMNTPPDLERRLSLPLLILYGLGVTVGAGIYVLVGLTAAEAGFYAPVSFLVAAIVVAFTGFTYAELTSRYPVSAGEAEYIQKGFGPSDLSRHLSLLIGLLVASSGVISAAVVSIGAASYLTQFISVSPDILTVIIILSLGLIAAKGILESVSLAAILTLIELFGLGFVIYYGIAHNPDILNQVNQLLPPFEITPWKGIVTGSLLAFFAFIGFEDLANIAEEAKHPTKTMPIAILVTLVTSTIIYLIVVSVVVLSIPMEDLKHSASPLALIFINASPATQAGFTLIATVATLNGVLIQMIMSSRVLFGLSKQNKLPKALAYISPRTHTPIVATAFVVGLIILLALFLPIAKLAEMTSQIALVIFSFVNLALVILKLSGKTGEAGCFEVPLWVPLFGFLSCVLLLGFTSFL